ncbi:hypothetical protein [Actinomyces oricola]
MPASSGALVDGVTEDCVAFWAASSTPSLPFSSGSLGFSVLTGTSFTPTR